MIGLEKLILSHTYLPFINIKWGTENVLQNTVDNFASKKLKYKFLDKKIDIDTIIDIENRKYSACQKSQLSFQLLMKLIICHYCFQTCQVFRKRAKS